MVAQVMGAEEAFSHFIQQLQAGGEGVFFSYKDLAGQHRWICGWGKSRTVEFDTDQYPVFLCTPFEGGEYRAVRFEEWVGSERMLENTDPSASLRFAQDDKEEILSLRLEMEEDMAQYSNETKESFITKVKEVQEVCRKGEVWVVNLTHELRGELNDERVLWATFLRFLQSGKAHVGGLWWTKEQKFCSMSPELFLHQKGDILETRPIKGTGTRSYLETSEKERSELYMVTDLLRNDLGQIARRVWVPNDRVFTDLGAFWHTHAEICAEVPQLTWEQYKKLLPCGSISGAPKERVMQYIRTLESYDRGYYTGTFGVRFSAEEAIFNILIRTLFVNGKEWRFPVGGGITYESDPVAEWEESLQKAQSLIRFGSR